jgi:hypothetical protein
MLVRYEALYLTQLDATNSQVNDTEFKALRCLFQIFGDEKDDVQV